MTTTGYAGVDRHVGTRLRQLRTGLGITEKKLGNALEVPAQQIRKYEEGKERIPAIMLQKISKLLTVPVSYFFEQYTESAAGHHEDASASVFEGHALTRAFLSIKDPTTRSAIVYLVELLAYRSPP